MARILQLNNAANWEQIYNTSVSAVFIKENLHVPIAEITIPLILDKHVLAIYVTTAVPEGREWFFAGYLNQKFELGLTVGGTPEADELSRRQLSLNRIKLIIFPKLSPTYAISLNVPKWFKSVTVTVWQYVGPDSDSVEESLARIETAISSDNLAESLRDDFLSL